jgi:hypothetical protein
LIPKKEAEVPAEEEKTEDRKAHENVEISCFGEKRSATRNDRIPSGNRQRELFSPDPVPDGEAEHQQPSFQERRVSEARRRGNNPFKAIAIFGRYDVSLKELADDSNDSPMNHHFCNDQ